MIEVCNVTKKFGNFTAISNLSFTVEKSSIYGLVGYNGAGKTTLLKTISGVYMADGGEVKINGENVFDNENAKQRMFYVPDDIYFQAYSSMDKMAKFYNGYYPNFSFSTYEKLTKVFELDPKKRINGFSKGMQRQAELVLALSTNPEFLLLDESFDGLDPAKRALIKNMLTEYMSEKDVSIIVSSHNLYEIESLCDHVGLINGKKLALDCSIHEMSRNKTKYRVVFDHTASENDFDGITLKSFKPDGNIAVVMVNGAENEVEANLHALKPLLIEKLPLSLEEIFLSEMEGTDYDFSKIFEK